METARDHIRELTALFLGEEDSGDDRGGSPGHPDDGPESPSERSEHAPGVTLLVCGHLPVMTGPWVSQYGAQSAVGAGPVGLVRLEGGRCGVEIFGLGRDHVRYAGESQLEVIRRFGPEVRRWMVSVDDRDIGAAVRAGASSLLVLTSSERAAVIRAFELAKAGRHRAAAQDSLDVGVVVAGAASDAVEVVAETLFQASARHMDQPLGVRDAVPALAAIEDVSKMLFEESVRADAAAVVSEIMTLRSSSSSSSRSHPAADVAGQHALRLTEVDDSQESAVDHVVDSKDPQEGRGRPGRPPLRLRPTPAVRTPGERFGPRRPTAVEAPDDGVADQALEHVLDAMADESPWISDLPRSEASALDSTSMPSPSPSSPTSSSSIEPVHVDKTLVSLVPGLRLLPWVPPTKAQIEVAVDFDGRMHLLGRDGTESWLRAAEAWSRGLPAEMLEAAGIDASGGLPPVEHLFAEHAPNIAHLHGTGVRLHLLDASGDRWRAFPLNDER